MRPGPTFAEGTVKISISLTDQQAEHARRQVAEGRFPSTSAVIQQALEAKRREDQDYEAWKAGFAAMMRDRMTGEFVGMDAFRHRIEPMMDAKQGAPGLED